MDVPAEALVVVEHELSKIPNLGEPADTKSEEQANPDSDVPEQYKEELEKPSPDEELKDPKIKESGNPNDESQVNMNIENMADELKEDQAIPSHGAPADVDGGEADAEQLANAEAEDKKWPGWPGESVFRVLVPVQKVGAVIGRKGEFIKKMCEESRARIKILDGPPGVPERAVLTAV